MKLIEKIAKRFTKSASDTVKTEMKKTAIDLLPIVTTVITAVVGIVIFKGVTDSAADVAPMVSRTSITTNNYFFNEVSEETMMKIMEGK